MELYAWIDATREAHLTIQDVIDLEDGQVLELVCLDRNVCDSANENNPPDVVMPAAEFLRGGYHLDFTKGRGISGRGFLKYPLGTDIRQGAEGDRRDFWEFDIEHAPGYWYPLEEGSVPKKDSQGVFSFQYDAPRHWTDFPASTRVGWRGPAIVVSRLVDLPDMACKCG